MLVRHRASRRRSTECQQRLLRCGRRQSRLHHRYHHGLRRQGQGAPVVRRRSASMFEDPPRRRAYASVRTITDTFATSQRVIERCIPRCASRGCSTVVQLQRGPHRSCRSKSRLMPWAIGAERPARARPGDARTCAELHVFAGSSRHGRVANSACSRTAAGPRVPCMCSARDAQLQVAAAAPVLVVQAVHLVSQTSSSRRRSAAPQAAGDQRLVEGPVGARTTHPCSGRYFCGSYRVSPSCSTAAV